MQTFSLLPRNVENFDDLLRESILVFDLGSRPIALTTEKWFQ